MPQQIKTLARRGLWTLSRIKISLKEFSWSNLFLVHQISQINKKLLFKINFCAKIIT
jgi:hypothetical protein